MASWDALTPGECKRPAELSWLVKRELELHAVGGHLWDRALRRWQSRRRWVAGATSAALLLLLAGASKGLLRGLAELGVPVLRGPMEAWRLAFPPPCLFEGANASHLPEDRQVDVNAAPSAFRPTLFCYSVVLPKTFEVELIQKQFDRGRVGIFSCNAWAVYSNTSLRVSNSAWTEVLPGELKLDQGTFFRLWIRIIGKESAMQHDWIVKSDVDAVFFPSRLRALLRHKWAPLGTSNDSISLQHCYNRVVPLYPEDHGPIIVISQQALRNYAERISGCPHGLYTEALHKGEEEISRLRTLCLGNIAATQVDAFGLLAEMSWACSKFENVDSSGDENGCCFPYVAFHPFKSVESYFECRDLAVRHGMNVSFSKKEFLEA